MYFKSVNQKTPEIEKKLIKFFKESKPYDFCEKTNGLLFKFEFNKFWDNLSSTCEFFSANQNNEIVAFAAIEKENNKANICFACAFYNKNTFTMPQIKKCWWDFMKFYKKIHPEIDCFYAEVLRNFKIDSYLKFIKKYTAVSETKINLDTNRVLIYYYL